MNKINSIDKRYVRHLGPVKHQVLLEMYKSSFCTLCPAIYEASALPMLESFSMKTYVIISDIKQHLEESKQFKVLSFKTKSVKDLEEKFLYLDKISKLDLKNYTNFNYRIIKKRSWFLQSKEWISICEKLFKLRIKKDE